MSKMWFLSLVFSGASHSNSSTSLQTGGLAFGGSKDGMHQRSFSVSSADQWNEAINTSTSSGARKTCPPNPNPGKDLKPKFSHVEGIDPAAAHFHNEALAMAATSATSVARWRRGREKEESRLTCRCVARYNLSHGAVLE